MRGRYEPRLWEWNPGIYAPARNRKSCPLRRVRSRLDQRIRDRTARCPRRDSVRRRASDCSPKQRGAPGTPASCPPSSPHRVDRLVQGRGPPGRNPTTGACRSQTRRRAIYRPRIGRDPRQHRCDAARHRARRGTEEFTEADLLDVHRLILKRSRTPRLAGHFREVQNWIGGNDYNPCGADFVPAPPEQLPTLLADLCRFCNDDALPPIGQAAIAHAQFETIHPFEDGNGRTGRALVQVILRRRGLAPTFVPPLSVVLAHDKERYIGGLTVYREDRLAEWIEIFASASVRAAQLAERYIDSVDKLQRLWREQLQRSRDPALTPQPGTSFKGAGRSPRHHGTRRGCRDQPNEAGRSQRSGGIGSRRRFTQAQRFHLGAAPGRPPASWTSSRNWILETWLSGPTADT